MEKIFASEVTVSSGTETQHKVNIKIPYKDYLLAIWIVKSENAKEIRNDLRVLNKDDHDVTDIIFSDVANWLVPATAENLLIAMQRIDRLGN